MQNETKFAMNITQQKLNWHWSFQVEEKRDFKTYCMHRSETNLDDACDFLLRLLDEYDQF